MSPGKPETALDAFRFEPAAHPGLYAAAPALAARVVVLSELPRTRETLLLRLLGRGRVLAAALADIAALPTPAWEKSVAFPLLIHFQFEVAPDRVLTARTLGEVLGEAT